MAGGLSVVFTRAVRVVGMECGPCGAQLWKVGNA